MLVGNSSPDAASRAAIRLLMDWLPGASAVEGSTDLDLSSRADQPQLVSRRSSREDAFGVRVPGVDRTMISEFGAFSMESRKWE
jgi:hypothetical protein